MTTTYELRDGTRESGLAEEFRPDISCRIDVKEHREPALHAGNGAEWKEPLQVQIAVFIHLGQGK